MCSAGWVRETVLHLFPCHSVPIIVVSMSKNKVTTYRFLCFTCVTDVWQQARSANRDINARDRTQIWVSSCKEIYSSKGGENIHILGKAQVNIIKDISYSTYKCTKSRVSHKSHVSERYWQPCALVSYQHWSDECEVIYQLWLWVSSSLL